jgi:hypothetical protein
MPDPIPVAPTDQTSPLDAGHTTTEYVLAKVMIYAGIALAVLSGVAEAVNQIAPILPPNSIITKIGLICGSLAATLSTIMYGQQRVALKKAALNAAPAVGDPSLVVKQ